MKLTKLKNILKIYKEPAKYISLFLFCIVIIGGSKPLCPPSGYDVGKDLCETDVFDGVAETNRYAVYGDSLFDIHGKTCQKVTDYLALLLGENVIHAATFGQRATSRVGGVATEVVTEIQGEDVITKFYLRNKLQGRNYHVNRIHIIKNETYDAANDYYRINHIDHVEFARAAGVGNEDGRIYVSFKNLRKNFSIEGGMRIMVDCGGGDSTAATIPDTYEITRLGGYVDEALEIDIPALPLNDEGKVDLDYVIVDAGGNDVEGDCDLAGGVDKGAENCIANIIEQNPEYFGFERDGVRKTLEDLVHKIQGDTVEGCKIINVAYYYQIEPLRHPLYKFIRFKRSKEVLRNNIVLDQLVETGKSFCEEAGCIVVDLRPHIVNPEPSDPVLNLLYDNLDGIHATRRGGMEIAKLICNEIGDEETCSGPDFECVDGIDPEIPDTMACLSE